MKRCRRLSWAIALICAAGQTSAQDLSVAEVRQLGMQSLAAGDVAQATTIANALLRRDPDDVEALLLVAQIATAVGDDAQAATFAKRAYWQARNSTESFFAARRGQPACRLV